MKVGRIVSAWLGALCLGMALTAGCAVAGGKADQAEAVQAASDGSECRAEERMGEASKIWKEAVYEQQRQGRKPDLTRMPELEKRYREIVTCLKPALLAGQLADPKDHKRFAGAMHQWTIALSYLGRKKEARALAAERLELIDAGLLGAETVLERRTQLFRDAVGTGNWTLVREQADALIALALKVGITTEEIEEQAKARSRGGGTVKLGSDGRADQELERYLGVAILAWKELDLMERMLQTKVCGKVMLADGGDEKIAATLFDGGGKPVFVTVKSGEAYCLPSPGQYEHALYVFFTAPWHLPQAQTTRISQGDRLTLPDMTLQRQAGRKRGAITGMVGVGRERLSKAYPNRVLQLKGRGLFRKFTSTTNEDGVFTFEVPAGTYRITVPPESGTLEVSVRAGETTIVPLIEPGPLY